MENLGKEMTDEQFKRLGDLIVEKIHGSVAVATEKYVNGKIRNLDKKIDDYIISDNEWKKAAQPTIELGNNIRGFGKVAVYLLGIGATLFAVIKGLKK